MILEKCYLVLIRRAVLSAGSSMLKWGFGTATLVDVEKLHRTVDKMHRTGGNIIHLVNHQMTYVRSLDCGVKFNTEAVETLSERVKAIMLYSNKWKDETDIAIDWLKYTLYRVTLLGMFVRFCYFGVTNYG